MTSGVANDSSADTEWGRAIEKPKAAAVFGKDDDEEETLRSVVEDEEDDSVDIAIVGGGLVGLAVAIGLRNNTTTSKFRVKVYEQAPELRSKSQGILAIHANGMNALESIDPEIPNKINQVGCERHSRVITTILADGTVKETIIDTATESMEKYGRMAVGITWHNCQQVLASLVQQPHKKEEAEEEEENVIVTSRSLSYFVESENDDSVRLHFEDGSVVKAKIMLACDGVFSVARRQMYPNDSPIYFGQLNWGTVIETSKLPEDVHPPNAVHIFQHKGDPLWMSMLNDGGSGHSFWQFRVSDPKQSMALSASNGRGGLGLPGVKEKLITVARASCELVARAIEAIPEEQIFERSIVGHSALPSWLSSEGGRVALVGDSAHGMHPNIAQGANSAFESANCIVKALRETNGDVSSLKSALASYEAARKPRADVVQRFAMLCGAMQSTGKHYIEDRSILGEMLEWIRNGSDPSTTPPPEGATKVLDSFDPCTEDGISRLWS
jgi:2-polyprenyl-6-methoxyphenol hydroxylase-like FAD-dependent oxidoreductase